MQNIQREYNVDYLALAIFTLKTIKWKISIVSNNENDLMLLTQKNSLPIMHDSVTRHSKIWKSQIRNDELTFLEKRKEYDIYIFVSSEEKNA